MDGGQVPGLEPVLARAELSREERMVPPPYEAGRLQVVEIRRLMIDPAFQRVLTKASMTRIRQMAASFDWRKFGALSGVVRRDCVVLVDGQHRALAAWLAGCDEVPVMVTAEAGGEAESFIAINRDRAKVSQQALFFARRAAGEPEAERLWSMLEEKGLTVRRATGALRPGEISCVGTLEKAVKEHGEGVLDAALDVLKAADRVPEGDAYRSPLGSNQVRAVALVVRELFDASDRREVADLSGALDRLEDVLGACSINDFVSEAFAAGRERGGAGWRHLARLIANELAFAGGPEIAIGV